MHNNIADVDGDVVIAGVDAAVHGSDPLSGEQRPGHITVHPPRSAQP